MKLLSKGDGRVVKIVQKNKLSPNAAYRPSQFLYAMETPDGAVLKNTLTKQVYALEADEWDSARAGDISHPAVQELAKARFLTEADYDELSQYNLVLSVLRTMEKKGPGVAAYTILPTTGCNARSDRRLRIGYCMADSGGSHVIVDPEGGLHLCEHVTNAAPFGSVFDETIRFPVPTVKLAEECKTCDFLPECAAFRKNGCPETTASCPPQ